MINLNTPTKLPSKIRWYWLTKIIILIVLFSFIFSLPFLFFSKSAFGDLFKFSLIFIGIPIFLYLLLYYNSFSFLVEDTKITINSGVVIKHSKSIPFNIIQNVENIRGILHRLFNISKVNIWTSSPEQIKAYRGSTAHKPDGSLDLLVEDGDWLKNFILGKRS